ncbi:MAG: LptE family protein [Kiritimatiellia bacterium]
MRTLQMMCTLPLISLLLLQAGCVGYQLGTMLPDDIQSVYVPTVQNQTQEPLLENDVTGSVLSAIQRDGSLKIEVEDQADAVLYVVITDFSLEPLSFSQTNRDRPNEYRLILRARAEMVRRSTGEVLVRDDKLQGRSTFTLAGDLTSGKLLGLPGAADDLARRISATITEAWVD